MVTIAQALPLSINTMIHQLSGGPISYPQVSGGTNQQAMAKINQEITQQVQLLIQKQQSQNNMVTDLLGTYEIKTNERYVLSLTLTNYTYFYHAAHGMTIIKALTFDTRSGKSFTLSELFKKGSPYVDRLSDIIQKQIKERQIPLLDDFTKIKPDQDFYIADKALVVYFQLYEITPYYIGLPMFPISVFSLQDIVDEEGPLGRMATNS